MVFNLSEKSLHMLEGVHEDLVKVVKEAIKITPIDFGVTEGLRSVTRQRQLVKDGKSQTMLSRHLTGHAVDLVAYVNGKVTWEGKYYNQIANAMLESAAKLDIPIIWGGTWKTLVDKCHFELNKNFYKGDEKNA